MNEKYLMCQCCLQKPNCGKNYKATKCIKDNSQWYLRAVGDCLEGPNMKKRRGIPGNVKKMIA